MRLLLLLALFAPAAAAQVRIEPRQLVKERHWFFSGGLTWLDRHDYYRSPGVIISATFYPRENDGVEVRAGLFASSIDGATEEVIRATGLKPDVQEPQSFLMVGWRHSLTYGKVALGSDVVHFDVQTGLHAGPLFTDHGATPALSGSAGVVARLGNRGYAQLDLAVIASHENRSTSTLVFGFLPLLTFGFSL